MRGLLDLPVFQIELRNSFKLAGIVGNEDQIIGKCCGRNPQIVSADGSSLHLQISAQIPINDSAAFVEEYGLDGFEKFALFLSRSCGVWLFAEP